MKFRLPHLTPVAKAQLWGMGVGLGTALLAVEHTQVGYRIFLVGAAGAWVASEYFLARRLVGSDWKTLAVAILSGVSFPWIGFIIAFGLNAIAP
ncbi:hypothetical protein [Candidatus Viadribacter manganicus]|uniref:Uncharacterized protein n=1 Tax=Candidatus Viadribacter manganicus TaxID=1759059 RepID=A0A1B1AG78_9PROT|nr:hypothetical protein [Candidatus Viadribacter manganicus]ANP45558.1 hypothetical protein ATE48_06330 [Candidatus Viadribacter manganicus]